LTEYLGDVWEEMWDATLFRLKAAEMRWASYGDSPTS